jgi:hypothetical protein
MQYQQMLQQINAYIAQNYTGQDANQLLAIYMQQANFGMQQQPMMQQPMQYLNQQPYNQQNYQQPMQNSYLRNNNF